MSVEVNATLSFSAEHIAHKFDENLNSSKNMKSEIKLELINCKNHFIKIINEQNLMINNLQNKINVEMQAMNDRHLHVLCDINKSIAIINNNIRSNSGPNITTKSYSSVIQSRKSSPQERESIDNLIIIKPKDCRMKSFETEKIAKTIINQNKGKTFVKNARKISKGGLILECNSFPEREELVKILADKNDSLTISRPAKRMPKIAIYSVPQEVKSDDLINEIIENNIAIKNYLKTTNCQDLKEEIKVKFMLRKHEKSHHNNWVIEVSPEMRKVIVNMRSILIDWKSCHYADYMPIIRCYKCNDYSHYARDCTREESCGHCGQSHKTKDCDCSHQKFCTNCDRRNKSSNGRTPALETSHSSFDHKCETYLRIKALVESNNNYE